MAVESVKEVDEPGAVIVPVLQGTLPAEAISRSKAIQQIIAVTHSEAFAEKAEHVIRAEKEDA